MSKKRKKEEDSPYDSTRQPTYVMVWHSSVLHIHSFLHLCWGFGGHNTRHRLSQKPEVKVQPIGVFNISHMLLSLHCLVSPTDWACVMVFVSFSSVVRKKKKKKLQWELNLQHAITSWMKRDIYNGLDKLCFFLFRYGFSRAHIYIHLEIKESKAGNGNMLFNVSDGPYKQDSVTENCHRINKTDGWTWTKAYWPAQPITVHQLWMVHILKPPSGWLESM